MYLLYVGTHTPYWLIKSTTRPVEIIFIQILQSVLNAVPIYSTRFIIVSNNDIRINIQTAMQLCQMCYKMIVYDSNVL